MTAAEAQTKRNELLAVARRLEWNSDDAIASQCRILADNLKLMASDDPADRERGQRLYESNCAGIKTALATMQQS